VDAKEYSTLLKINLNLVIQSRFRRLLVELLRLFNFTLFDFSLLLWTLVSSMTSVQNRRQNVFNIGLYICAGGLDILKFDKNSTNLQRCTGAGVSKSTPAGVLTIFEIRSGAGVDFFKEGPEPESAFLLEVTLFIIDYYYCRCFFTKHDIT